MKIYNFANFGAFFAFWGGIIAPSLLPILGPVFVVCVAVSIVAPEPGTTEPNQEQTPGLRF